MPGGVSIPLPSSSLGGDPPGTLVINELSFLNFLLVQKSGLLMDTDRL